MAIVQRILANLLVLTAFSWSVTSPVLAATSALTFTIHVQDQFGTPIPNADIGIPVGEFISHHSTDAEGNYTSSVYSDPRLASAGGVCATDFQIPSGPSACALYSATTQNVDGNFTLTIIIPIPTISGAPPGPPGTPRGWIFGAVAKAGSHTPVPGVTVQLANTPLHTQTGPDGRYQFPAISTTDGANGGPSYTVTITPPPDYVVAGPTNQTVTVVAGHGAEADFTLAPAFVPFWVESFVPSVTLWSGPNQQAVAFGARPQWNAFLVVAPQQGPRLFVWDPTGHDYAWLDAAAVGPSGPPTR